jgi:uncharacterized protein YijF (DUF1287 family)
MINRRALLASLAATPAAAAAPPSLADQFVAAARRQIGVTRGYDPAYRRIGYPMGDVPRGTGVCAEVVIRAGRDAWGADLQRLVHQDMMANFGAYPHRWGLPAPDSNIDHRRVPNLETYWTRHGAAIWRASGHTIGSAFPGPLLPGDILTWRTFFGGGPHVAIVSRSGTWANVVQNYGRGATEDLMALQWLDGASGHFRWRPGAAARRA